MRELNQENFEEVIQSSKKLILVDFWAPWCGPCQMLAPEIEALDKDEELKEKIEIFKVNVDENSDLANKFNVMSIPTLIFFKEGKIIEQLTGFHSKDDLKEIIKKL